MAWSTDALERFVDEARLRDMVDDRTLRSIMSKWVLLVVVLEAVGR